MERVRSQAGQLLIMTYLMYRERSISNGQRAQLKDLILEQDEAMNQVYEEYLRDGTKLTLGSKMIGLVRVERNARLKKRNSMEIEIPAKAIQKMPQFEDRL